MTTPVSGGQHGNPRPPRVPQNARRTRDKRRTEKLWIPTYLPNYVDQVGEVAIVVYMLLARACCYGWEPRWPSIAQLARMIGKSRSTAERALRALREVGLIETEECLDEFGQHSNFWDLTDPFDLREKLDSPGAPLAGAVSDDGGAPSAATAPPVSDDGGAPSAVTAPPLGEDKDLNVCEREHTHTPDPDLPPTAPDLADAEKFCAAWMRALPPGKPGFRAEQEEESRWAGALLLSRGWTIVELLRSLADPERDPYEFPSAFAKRHGPNELREARKAATSSETRQERAQTRQTALSERAAQARLSAAYDALPAEERAALEEKAGQTLPPFARRPTLLRLKALELFAAQTSTAPAIAGAVDADQAGDRRAAAQ